jgi:predicted Kef-type K+ transport protein
MTTAAIWLVFAFVLGLAVRAVGLPPLVGYLLAGFALSVYGYRSNEILEQAAEIGVLVLLFSVGLKLRLKSLFRYEVLGGATLHMLATVLVVGLVLALLGTPTTPAFLVAAALAFSSTVVAAKIMEAKRELRAFHGRVTIGVLIVQDIAAVGLLAFLGGASPSPWAVILVAVFLFRAALHRLLDLSGHDELLILYGLLLALVLGGGGFAWFGLSPELGALLLGVLVAEHKRATELANAIWSLKEILLVGFFLQIGLAGQPSMETVGYALLLLLLLPVKAALFFFLFAAFRLRARSAFLAALGLATYSEFGLIVAQVAVSNGWLDSYWLVLLALTVAFSFIAAAPLNRYSHQLYNRWEPALRRFESRHRHPDDQPLQLGNSNILIFGMGRVGTGAYDFFTQRHHRIAGMDSDPGKVEKHRNAGRRVLYADAEDPGLWDKLSYEHVNAVLLAVPDLEAKRMAARQLRAAGYHGFIGATVVFPEEEQKLLNAGVSSVYNYFQEVGVGFAETVLEDIRKADTAGGLAPPAVQAGPG